MSGKLGTLTVDLIAKIGGFTGPMSKAELQGDRLAASMKKTEAGINKQVAALQLQSHTLGMSTRQATLYRLGLEGATKAQLSQADAALKSIETFEKATSKSTHFSKSLSMLAGKFLILELAATHAARIINSTIFEFNSTLETAELGIAASLMTGGEFVDKITGKVLNGQEALTAAHKMARSELQALQQANLQTIATLDQLVRAYQETLPVAMEEGLSPERAREFSVAMVQAAGAIGISLDQLGEETRSVLTGNVNPRTSRIATVLGLQNKDIREVKEQGGDLFDFLMDRLSAYRLAGVESQATWSGVWSNAVDMLKIFSAEATKPIFEAVKADLSGIVKYMTTIDEKTKEVKLNPEFVEDMRSVRTTVTSVVAELYRFSALLDKIGGTLTIFGAMTTFGSWDKQFREWNSNFEKAYRENEEKRQELANRDAGIAAPRQKARLFVAEESLAKLEKARDFLYSDAGSRLDFFGTLEEDLKKTNEEINITTATIKQLKKEIDSIENGLAKEEEYNIRVSEEGSEEGKKARDNRVKLYESALGEIGVANEKIYEELKRSYRNDAIEFERTTGDKATANAIFIAKLAELDAKTPEGQAKAAALKVEIKSLTDQNKALEESIEGVSDEFSAFVGDLGGLSLYQSSLDKMVEGLSATKVVDVPFSLRIDEGFIEKLRDRLGEESKNSRFSLLGQEPDLDVYREQLEIQQDYLKLVDELKTEEERLNEQLKERLDTLSKIQGLTTEDRDILANKIVGQAFPENPDSDEFESDFSKLDRKEQELADSYERQLSRLEEFREEYSELNETWDAKEEALQKAHQSRLGSIQLERSRLTLTSASKTFDSLAEITGTFAGEESEQYKTLFAISKTFALAEATVALFQAMAKAGAAGITPLDRAVNIAAAAAIMGGIISQIAAVGMAHDGIDSVPKTGSWILQKGERVTTEKTSAKLDHTLDMVQKGAKPSSNMTFNIQEAPGTRVSVEQTDEETFALLVERIEARQQSRMARGAGMAGFFDQRYRRRT